MKKLLAFLMALFMVMSLCACGGTKELTAEEKEAIYAEVAAQKAAENEANNEEATVELDEDNSEIEIEDEKYNDALTAFKNGKYEDAFNQFLELEDYKDSQEWRDKSFKFYLYELGVELYEKGEYIAAKTAFEEVGNIADSHKYYYDIVLNHKDTLQLLRGKWMAKAGFQRHHDYSYYEFDTENLKFTLYWDNGRTKWTKTCDFVVSDNNTVILKNLMEFKDDFDTLSDIKCTLSPDGNYLTTPFEDKWGYNGYATFIKFED